VRQHGGFVRSPIVWEDLAYLQASDVLQNSDADLVLAIARDIRLHPTAWNGLRDLNSESVGSWDRLLYQLIKLQPAAWETKWSRYVEFVKILASNWHKTIPELLDNLSAHDISIDDFFKLERNTTFRLAALLGDVQTIYNRIHKDDPIELAPAIARFSSAFLPRVVSQLEEYGLPRMLSRKICQAGVVNLETIEDVHTAVAIFQSIGLEGLLQAVNDLDPFDIYILRDFFLGLSTSAPVSEAVH
jgi:hypothetical protein